MRRVSMSWVMMAACVVLLTGRLWGQSVVGKAADASSGQTAKVQGVVGSAGESPAASEPRGRAPRFFGQLSLTDDQRSAIDAIQRKYQTQIAEMQRKLDQLRDSRDKETRAALEPEQQQKLAELIRKDRERRNQQVAARRAARSPAAAVPAASATAGRPAASPQ